MDAKRMVEELHLQYCKESYDKDGVLASFDVMAPENFNFAYDVVRKIAEIEPDRRAMLWCDEQGKEHTFSFSDIERMSNRAANLFQSYGIGRGDKVMLVLKRHYQFWFAILGLHKLGAVAVPGTHLLTEKDLRYRFEMAEVKAIVCTSDGDVRAYADAAQQACPWMGVKMSAGGYGEPREGWIDFDRALESQPDTFERQESHIHDMMLLYFTSGTTGQPKMVVHNYEYPIAHIVTAKHWHCVDPNGLHLTLAETGWAKAVWGKLYGQWFLGAGIFVYDFEKFVPSDLLERIQKYRITTFCAPPTVFRFFIKEDLSKYDLSCLQHTTIAGEALNPEVFQQFYKATGLKLMEAFGQTETTVQCATLRGMNPRPGSMGKRNPVYDLDLVDEDLHPVRTGEVGEIIIRPREHQVGIFGGYYRDPELTAQVWRGGVYHTGDTAWQDEDGYFWYVGRTDDVIKASGYRIGPFEVESVLIEHPAVLECAVTGAPDPVRGQVVKATIVLAKGYEPSDALAKELQNHVKHQTAPYKYPRIVEFVPELPKTISGKIRRTVLRGNADGQKP